jgi:hypothetical protein
MIFNLDVVLNKLLFFGLTYFYFHYSVRPAIKMKEYEFNYQL